MSYDYQAQKPQVLTDDGQRQFLRVRDFAQRALKMAGAVRCQELIGAAGSGDSWTMLACVDRLVELGELRELTPPNSCVGQHRVFVAARSND